MGGILRRSDEQGFYLPAPHQFAEVVAVLSGYKAGAPETGIMGRPGAFTITHCISYRRELNMRSTSIRLALVAAAAVAATTGAQAARTIDLSKLSPAQQAHHAKVQAKQRAVKPEYNYDIKPPVLKAVNTGGKVNAALKNAQAVVALGIVDNLAGIDSVAVVLESPSGQQASTTWWPGLESTRYQVQIGVDMSDATENGTWRILAVTLQDANGNSSYYGADTLAALGHTTFVVYGAAGDQTAPEVVAGGAVLTPVVSRSTPPPGMLPGSYARVGLQLNVLDTGASGIQSVSAEYCLNEYWDCFYVSGNVPVRGTSSATLMLGGHVYDWQSVGTYTPYSISVYDHAGNGRTYYYWETDFASLIDSPNVEIVE